MAAAGAAHPKRWSLASWLKRRFHKESDLVLREAVEEKGCAMSGRIGLADGSKMKICTSKIRITLSVIKFGYVI